jgi:Fe-S-cluster formation regulator IscX/YfhJ
MSCNTQIGGQYLGGLDTPIPREVMFPDFFAARRVVNLPKLADDRAFSMSNVAQAANNRWLDGVRRYIESIKAR